MQLLTQISFLLLLIASKVFGSTSEPESKYLKAAREESERNGSRDVVPVRSSTSQAPKKAVTKMQQPTIPVTARNSPPIQPYSGNTNASSRRVPSAKGTSLAKSTRPVPKTPSEDISLSAVVFDFFNLMQTFKPVDLPASLMDGFSAAILASSCKIGVVIIVGILNFVSRTLSRKDINNVINAGILLSAVLTFWKIKGKRDGKL